MKTDIHKFRVGRYSCTLYRDFDFVYFTQDFFTNAGKEALQLGKSKFGITEDTKALPYTVMLLQDGDRNILIDTGVGHFEEPLDFGGHQVELKGQILSLLENDGIYGSDITDVIITHLHPDHIGGVYSEDGNLNFPNASFYFHQKEWEFWNSVESNDQHELFRMFFEKNIAPLDKEKFRFILDDFEELLPEIISVNAPGHSMGHIALKIGNKGDQVLYTADAFIHPLHIENLQWQTNFDFDHAEASSTRAKLLELAYAEDLKIIATHFDFPGIGMVNKINNGWQWLPE